MNQFDGFLVVDKEKGYTSHDVVAKLRGILKMKKIGHAGTLDPDATGVLLVCLGRGTKLSARMMESEKEYVVDMLLGRTTDTQDTSGKTLSEVDVFSYFGISDPEKQDVDGEEESDEKNAVRERIREAIMSFEGGYDQIPPMYSAKKVNGKKLYEYAREGIEIERKPERVEIPSIKIESLAVDTASFRVRCSKGTYIRTLCHDIGETLGCGACMSSLKRTLASGFSLEEAHTLSEIEGAVKNGDIESFIVPLEAYTEQI